jgi:hypothetical protein
VKRVLLAPHRKGRAAANRRRSREASLQDECRGGKLLGLIFFWFVFLSLFKKSYTRQT